MDPTEGSDLKVDGAPEAPPGLTAFLVANEDDYLGSYDLNDPATPTFRDVLRDLAANFDRPWPEGYGGRELTLWSGGLLVAYLRRGPGGRLKLTLFR